jgi:hypothetical protein
MGDDPIAAPHTVMLHYDDDGNILKVTTPGGVPWDDRGPVPPDYIPPGQVRNHVLRLVKTQENPTCWYIIVGGRAYRICQ